MSYLAMDKFNYQRFTFGAEHKKVSTKVGLRRINGYMDVKTIPMTTMFFRMLMHKQIKKNSFLNGLSILRALSIIRFDMPMQNSPYFFKYIKLYSKI